MPQNNRRVIYFFTLISHDWRMRKSFALLLAATVIIGLTLGVANAAAPVVGKKCSKAGLSAKVAGDRFTCTKSGKKLIWKKVIPAVIKAAPSPSPTQTMDPAAATVAPSAPPEPTQTPAVAEIMTPITLSSFVSLAQSAMANSENAIPILDTANTVQVLEVKKNELPNFLFADTVQKFSFFGPTPLVEKDSSRLHGLSLVSADGRKVYQSDSAIPPWGVGFDFTSDDPKGRFIVETSATDNSGTYSWRLAYKSATGPWKYQSVNGISHKNDNEKFFDEVTLGEAGKFSIRLEFEAKTTFYGLGLADKAASVTPLLKSPAVRVLIVGDSWVWPSFNESGPVHVWDAYPGALSWLTGWNVISAGVRGQGYLSVAANETYKDRIVRDVIPQHPAVVIFTGSSNDHLFADQQIAEEMGRDIQALQKADPGVLIIVCSPYATGGDQKAPGQSKAMKAEANRIGVPYIDFINLPLFDQSNNGQGQLSQGHPTRLGSSYIAGALLKELAAVK